MTVSAPAAREAHDEHEERACAELAQRYELERRLEGARGKEILHGRAHRAPQNACEED